MFVDDSGPAFPVEVNREGGGMQTGPDSGWRTGMSLRDYFAAQALPSLVNLPTGSIRDSDLTHLFGRGRSNIRGAEIAAALAYEVADEMLKRRAAPSRAKASPHA